MELLPIASELEDNAMFREHPGCQDTLYMFIDFYKKVGYSPPWIGYYARRNGELVGGAAFKGRPVNGKVEIAYGTFPDFRQQGVAGEMCRELIQMSQKANPSVIISARTLPEENYSTKVLRKNGFVFAGTVFDEEDGDVWEWIYEGK